MILCVVLAGILQWLYRHGERNELTLQVGQVFGLGAIWFMGALIAVHGPALARYRAARVAAISWPFLFALSVWLRADGRCPDQWIYLILGVAFSLMILRFQAADVLNSDRPAHAPRWLEATAKVVGLASYPTYLFHGPLLLLIASANWRWGFLSDWRATWLVLVISGIGVGLLMGWFVERPIMAWRAGLLARLKESRVSRPVAVPANLFEVQP